MKYLFGWTLILKLQSKELREIGIQPNILLCRCDRKIEKTEKDKIALFCNVLREEVIQGLDVKNIYNVPLIYHEEGLDTQVLKHFSIKSSKKINLNPWKKIIYRINNPKNDNFTLLKNQGKTEGIPSKQWFIHFSPDLALYLKQDISPKTSLSEKKRVVEQEWSWGGAVFSA